MRKRRGSGFESCIRHYRQPLVEKGFVLRVSSELGLTSGWASVRPPTTLPITHLTVNVPTLSLPAPLGTTAETAPESSARHMRCRQHPRSLERKVPDEKHGVSSSRDEKAQNKELGCLPKNSVALNSTDGAL